MVMEEISMAYFNNLFASSNPSAIDEVIHLVDTAVTPSTNLNLLVPFSPMEIKMALFQMHPSKAPGPDGMMAPFFFFQKYWHIVGGDVSKAILDFLNYARVSKFYQYCANPEGQSS